MMAGGKLRVSPDRRKITRSPYEVHWGTSAPSDVLGEDGDQYHRYHGTGSELLYKKVSGSWVLTGGSGMTDPMTTRGDIVYRNASNDTARLPVGTDTYVLTSDGTDIAWAAPSGGGGGGEFYNHIINGDFRVNQRTDTSTGETLVNNEYKIDRWKDRLNAATGFITTFTSELPSTYGGITRARVLTNSTTTGHIGIKQMFEETSIYKGKTVTLSAWVRANNTNARIFISDNGTKYPSSAHSGSGWELLTVTRTISTSLVEVILAMASATGSGQ